jgi:hypothetical protein
MRSTILITAIFKDLKIIKVGRILTKIKTATWENIKLVLSIFSEPPYL